MAVVVDAGFPRGDGEHVERIAIVILLAQCPAEDAVRPIAVIDEDAGLGDVDAREHRKHLALQDVLPDHGNCSALDGAC
ncbi:hypothetical protein D9M68_799580 [compost metagenome]